MNTQDALRMVARLGELARQLRDLQASLDLAQTRIAALDENAALRAAADEISLSPISARKQVPSRNPHIKRKLVPSGTESRRDDLR